MKITEEKKAKMAEYGIPGYMHNAIIRYYENGYPPGDFLTAVINNNLKEAISRADDQNVHALKAYILWFYNQAPAGSWGFEGAVNQWVEEFHRDESNTD